MARPLVVDSFMFNGEFDTLELRLDTMAPACDYLIALEANVDHQNHPKPYHLTDELARSNRFDRWRDKLVVVQAHDLPAAANAENPAWTWEWAQREWTWDGLEHIEALRGEPLPDDTIVLHGDVDEICDPLCARNVRPKFKQFVVFDQRWHSFAVDWFHPDVWRGTVAVTLETARHCLQRKLAGHGFWLEFDYPIWQLVRNQRNGIVRPNFDDQGAGWSWVSLPAAGWHFTWMGGREVAIGKLGSFCHPEVADQIDAGLQSDLYLREGLHVDGRKMFPVEVDDSYPRWIRDGHAPAAWFRPR
jgi:beta-1,4-mannosyl-glycoprotein beta-1,4-N-acetylglucosaminyltransferase